MGRQAWRQKKAGKVTRHTSKQARRQASREAGKQAGGRQKAKPGKQRKQASRHQPVSAREHARRKVLREELVSFFGNLWTPYDVDSPVSHISYNTLVRRGEVST